MTFLNKIITREVQVEKPRQEISRSFDLYDASSVQRIMEAYIEKAVCDRDGRHLGFVSDIMISTWNNKPEYMVLDAKIKPWHLRNAQFLYPLTSVTDVSTVRVMIKDQRAHVYESSAFDPQTVELQETFPLLSLKSLAESEETPQAANIQRYAAPSEYWADGLW